MPLSLPVPRAVIQLSATLVSVSAALGCTAIVGPPGRGSEGSADAGLDATSHSDTDAGADLTACDGPAYLHGDLWTFWYNFRVACDPEHRRLWLCERRGDSCDGEAADYQSCLDDMPVRAGVCIPDGYCDANGLDNCGVDPYCTPRCRPDDICDTEAFFEAGDYEALRGHYYGYQWDASSIHRHNTVIVRAADDDRVLSAHSSHPGSADAHMEGLDNRGIGWVEAAQDLDDTFGAVACVELPTDRDISVFASWLSDFAHTSDDFPVSRTFAPFTARPGHHYLIDERGLTEMPTCSGPPSAIAERLPQAACSTAVATPSARTN